jgi:hypothetical protein
MSEGQIMSQGSSSGFGAAKFIKDKILVSWEIPVLSGKKYVVEVKFTKDERPLNVPTCT